MTTENANAALDRLIAFLAEAREINPVMPAQELHVLLLVAASRRGTSHRRIAEDSDLSRPSVSRNLNALGTSHRNGKAGHGLVAQVPDPHDMKAALVFLTARGRDVVRKLLEAATGEPAVSFSPPTVR